MTHGVRSDGSPALRPATAGTLRARLTLWSTAILLCGLIAYAAVVYIALRRVLWSEVDERLHHEIETVEGLLQPVLDAARRPHARRRIAVGR